MLFDHFASAVMVEAPKISEKRCLLPVSLSVWADGKLVLHYIESQGFMANWEGEGRGSWNTCISV